MGGLERDDDCAEDTRPLLFTISFLFNEMLTPVFIPIDTTDNTKYPITNRLARKYLSKPV